MTRVRYSNEVFESIVVLYAENVGEVFIFMDAIARSHRARLVTEFLKKPGIPAHGLAVKVFSLKYSNRIKLVWDMIGRSIRHPKAKLQGPQQLCAVLNAARDGLDFRDINRFINFVRQRYEAIVAAGGAQTRY